LKDLRLDGGGGEIYGKPVAWISVAAEGRGMGAHDALASVPGYLGATVTETACRRIPVARRSRAGRDSGRSALPVRGSRSMAGPPRPHQRPLTHRPLRQKRAPARDAGPYGRAQMALFGRRQGKSCRRLACRPERRL